MVLASTDDGSAILFHSECSVIANNFILRREDDLHIAEISRLMMLSPAEIVQQRPDVKYVLLRAPNFIDVYGDVIQLSKTNAVAQQLLTSAAPPPGFKLLKTIQYEINEEGATAIFARLYRVLPPDAAGDVAEHAEQE